MYKAFGKIEADYWQGTLKGKRLQAALDAFVEEYQPSIEQSVKLLTSCQAKIFVARLARALDLD